MSKIAVIGAGITGIAVAHFLKESNNDVVVYEKNNYLGGLASSYTKSGFTFDRFVHLGFSKNEMVNELLYGNLEVINHSPEFMSYYKNLVIKHPIQNNLYKLDVDEKIKAVKSLLFRGDTKEIKNYEDWLKVQYGEYFAENFPMRYTRKYWTVEADELDTDWVSVRMYVPDVDEVLLGAFSLETPKAHYVDALRYPKYGGFVSFLRNMIPGVSIQFEKELVEIDVNNKLLKFNDASTQSYDTLVSTIPLPELCKVIKDIPSLVRVAGDNLDYTSGVLVSLGFNKPNVVPFLCSYIYDEDLLPTRIHSPSIKSPFNAPDNCSSVVAEIYFSKYKPLNMSMEEILEKTIIQLQKKLAFNKEDIIVTNTEYIKYANVMFKTGIAQNRKTIHDFLDMSNIFYAGRFGEWDYLWSDQSLLSGKKVADKIIGK